MRNLAFISVLLLLASCSSDTSVITNPTVGVLSVIDTGCKSEVAAKANSDALSDEETISYSAEEKDGEWYLHVVHANSMFNCASDSIAVKSQVDDDNQISINEIENSYSANCTCAHDLTFNIGPLKEATDYKINLYKSAIKESDNYLHTQFSIKFSSNLSGKIVVE